MTRGTRETRCNPDHVHRVHRAAERYFGHDSLLPGQQEAMCALLEGRDPEPAETEPVGCSVKWKT